MVVACDSTLISHHSGYLTLDKEGVLFLPDLKKEVATPVIAAGRIRVKGGRSDSKSDITFTVQPDLTSPALKRSCHSATSHTCKDIVQ
jgi:hypothetical protein